MACWARRKADCVSGFGTAQTEEQEKKEKENDDSGVADKDERHARLRISDLATKQEHALTQPNWEVKERNGRRKENSLSYATDKPESNSETAPHVRVSVADGTMSNPRAARRLASSNRTTGTAIAFRGSARTARADD